MSHVETLVARIDAEFDTAKKRIEQFRQGSLTAYQQKQQRLETFEEICDRLRDIWRPRLDALAQRFNAEVNVTPLLTPTLRQAKFDFRSQLAKIELTFSAMTDADVRNLVLRYDLEVIPILMPFKNTDQLAVPLGEVDEHAVEGWIEDRILDFVRTYLDLHENQHYQGYHKGYLVEDPVAEVRFPKHAAAATCEWDGRTYYFISQETCQEFQRGHGISG